MVVFLDSEVIFRSNFMVAVKLVRLWLAVKLVRFCTLLCLFDIDLMVWACCYCFAILDTTMLSEVCTLADHTDKVWCVNWSFDGKFLATCSSDKTIRIYPITSTADKQSWWHVYIINQVIRGMLDVMLRYPRKFRPTYNRK